jgi:hypothetical protein
VHHFYRETSSMGGTQDRWRRVRRTEAAVLAMVGAIAGMSGPVAAQVAQGDSGTVAVLFQTFTRNRDRAPDTALNALHAVLQRPAAVPADSQQVAQDALEAANALFVRAHASGDSIALAEAIAYASFSDSVEASPVASFLLSALFAMRAEQWRTVAYQTRTCDAVLHYYDDSTLAVRYAERGSRLKGRWVPDPSRFGRWSPGPPESPENRLPFCARV